jgi:hypothetical protein
LLLSKSVIFKAKKSKPGVNSFSLFLAQASSGSRFFCLLIMVVVDVVLSLFEYRQTVSDIAKTVSSSGLGQRPCWSFCWGMAWLL